MKRAAICATGAVALLALTACGGYYRQNDPRLSGPTSTGIQQSMQDGALTPSEARRANQILVEGN